MLQRVADLFFLVVLRIIAVASAEQHEPTEVRMNKLPVTAFPALDTRKTHALQLGCQLANLSRHAETLPAGPRLCQQEFPAALGRGEYVGHQRRSGVAPDSDFMAFILDGDRRDALSYTASR